MKFRKDSTKGEMMDEQSIKAQAWEEAAGLLEDMKRKENQRAREGQFLVSLTRDTAVEDCAAIIRGMAEGK
jgi:hypothetical protein